MQIGKLYDVVFSTGRYEIDYENGVKCIKKTPKSYRVERTDGTTRLIGQKSILELHFGPAIKTNTATSLCRQRNKNGIINHF